MLLCFALWKNKKEEKKKKDNYDVLVNMPKIK